MKFLTNKDIEILRLVKEHNNTSKTTIAKHSYYIFENLKDTFERLISQKVIEINKTGVGSRTCVTITKRGNEVLSRL